MATLMSEGSRNDEALHIREDVEKRHAELKKRIRSWGSATRALGAGSLFLIGGGSLMLILGQLPGAIDLVSPAIETTGSSGAPNANMTGPELTEAAEAMYALLSGTFARIVAITMIIMGIVQGVARQSIASMATGIAAGFGLHFAPDIAASVLGISNYQSEPAPFAVIQSQFEGAVDSEDWPRAWQILEPIHASQSDLVMLKAQIAFQAGYADEGLSLVKTNGLGSSYPSEVWRLESLHANTTTGRGYQLSEGSQTYAEGQAYRRSRGEAMLRMAIPLGIIALAVGAVTIVLRRSVNAIEAWIKPGVKLAPAALGDEEH